MFPFALLAALPHAPLILAKAPAHLAPGDVIEWWEWAVFAALVLFFLALDLGVLGRRHDAAPSFRAALAWSALWVGIAGAFGVWVWQMLGAKTASIFAGGYLLELSLSVDNLFVFLLVFSFFKIPEEHRHRVLFWGILGAVFTRAAFIFGGITLVEKFSILLLAFGIFLVVTGVKMLLPEKHEPDLEKNLLVRLGRRFFRVAPTLDGRHFLTRVDGKTLATPLLLALLVIEGSDVIFAVDSIPAVLGILPKKMDYEEKMFLAFTSNIFAVLGLRSLFFALSGVMKFFHLLKYGLALILAFIGVKMIITEATPFDAFGLNIPDIHVPTGLSLGVIGGVLALTMLASVLFPQKDATAGGAGAAASAPKTDA
ncbi:MAG: TerC/Alx family metal homeostasis membrane protein [Puniceicoccales bacterium]|jgi:tellurite resistance protein TerC|nr:TerC/Alx family metal homeostasis membrane protein [Puniceicoccales bacterium]